MSLLSISCEQLVNFDYDITSDIILANDLPANHWPQGEYILHSALLDGDILELEIGFRGNPSKNIKLVAYNYWLETFPVQVDVLLSFIPDSLGNGFKYQKRKFNLFPLKLAYKESYPRDSGKIMIVIRYPGTPNSLILYTF